MFIESAFEGTDGDFIFGLEEMIEKVGLVFGKRSGRFFETGELVIIAEFEKTRFFDLFDREIFLAGEIDNFGDNILVVDLFIDDGTSLTRSKF